MKNTLTHGTSVQQKWAGLGGFSGPVVQPLHATRGALVGFPNAGKSFLLQSAPDTFIANLDKTPTTCTNPQATIWPGLEATTGRPIDTDGRPINLTWDKVLDKIKTLHKLAETNSPRPRMIVFDSMSEWIRLLMDWIPRNASSLSIGKNQEDGNWNAIDGRAAWDYLHRYTANTIRSLHSAGYGVWVTLHLKNEVIQLGENQHVIKPRLTLTDSHWGKILDIFDFIGYVTHDEKTISRPSRKTIEVRGKKTEVDHTVTETKRVYTLTVDKGRLEGIVKHRLPGLPEQIEIPSEDAWGAIESIYNQARDTAFASTQETN